MDFGNIGSYFELVLSKRLSAVDVDQRISHQHELGGFAALRPLLGDDDIQRIPSLYIYLDDEGVCTDRSWTTWYDTRRKQATRGPEYRLYYPDVEPVKRACAGDLTITCLTKDGELAFFFVASGSYREAEMLWLFGIDGEEGSFTPARDMERRIDATGAELLDVLGFEVEPPDELHGYLEDMLRLWPDAFPSGRAFSRFARDVSGIDPRSNPDEALVEYYNTQTMLFMGYERYEHERRLGPYVRNVGDPDYEAILKVAMSMFQRRRSAAGHALEYHLEALFDARDISYTAQSLTEGRERPDFIFPSISAYRDAGFPEAGLTLLGAKTTAKDRWRQILQEGRRVKRKHLITLEPAITVEQTDEMEERNLQLVVPAPIQSSYSHAQRGWLWSVEDFCNHVANTQAWSE